jgi:hypothetical protein
MEILDTLPRFEGTSTGDFLFSTTAGRQAVNGFSKAKSILDREMLAILREADPQAELPGFVIHDVRRSVRTKLSALRVQTEIAEMVIGHGKKGLARIYDQHHFEPEMRHALELWAAELGSISNPPPENVVPLERARI